MIGGCSLKPAIVPAVSPRLVTVVVVVSSASVRYWVTTVSPPTAPVATPTGSLSRVTLPSYPSRATETEATRGTTEATTPSSSTPSTSRTCSDTGVKGYAVEGQPAGVAVVQPVQQPAVRDPPRRAGQQLDPAVVGERAHRRRGPRRDVDLAQLESPLVAGQQGQQRLALAPLDLGEVLEHVAVELPVGAPVDIHPRSVERDHVQRHGRVGLAGLRVALPDRLDLRVRGVGDVPHGHRASRRSARRAAPSRRGPTRSLGCGRAPQPR